LARVRMGRIAADAGFVSEPNHTFARHECRVRTIIPATHGRPTDKPATGHYRRLMQTRFDLTAYRDRVQIEAVISMSSVVSNSSSADERPGANAANSD
jgi:hypothetical protein